MFCRHTFGQPPESVTKAQPNNAERIRIVSTPERSQRPTEQASGEQNSTEKPEPGDRARAEAKEMARAYEDRPTAVLPGSNGTVTGTAVNDWLDDDGQPIYGNDNKTGQHSEG